MDNYPPGAANDPNAPYNQSEPDPVEVDVVVSQSLSKSTTISTTDYIASEWEDYEPDECGGPPIHMGGVDLDFSNSNLKEEYVNQGYTPLELLKAFQKLATWVYDNELYLQKHVDTECPYSKWQLAEMARNCEEWEEDEFIVERELYEDNLRHNS